MFGSTNPFGQSSASPFGQTSSSNPFGAQQQSAFGQTNAASNPFARPTPAFGVQTGTSSPFGGTSAFGQPPAPAFGNTATGAFGQQSSSPGFGATSTGAFGQQSSSPGFGATSTGAFGQQSNPGFGASTGAFGQQQSTPGFGSTSTGAFGQQQSTLGFGSSTGAFGQQQSTPGFGSSNGAFGQQQSTPGFGSTSTGAFGQQQSTPGFGSTSTGAFGQQQSTPGFGSTSTGAFGQQQSTPGFGSTSTGAFGQPSTSAFGTPSPSPFGATTGTGSLFGQTPGFGGFGSSPNQSSPFGSTVQQTQPIFGNSNFGTTTTPGFSTTTTPTFGSTSTSLFGPSSTPTPFGSTTTPGFGSSGTGAFGVSSAPGFGASVTPSFGTPTSAFSFGSSPPFGQSGAATGSTPFGTTQPFGSQPSPFGSQTAASMFGQAPFGNQSVGTRIQPYVQTPDADTATSGTQPAKLDSISAMPAYKEKSHEELRWEDYQHGDKGGPNSTPVVNNLSLPQPSFQINPPAPVNPFSNSLSHTGAFGTTSSPFSSNTTTVFGQTTSQSPVTNTTPSLFNNMPLPTTNPFNSFSSISNNSQSAGLIQSSPTIGQQPFSFNPQTSTPAFNTSIFNKPVTGMTGGLNTTSSPFPTFQQPAPVQPASLFSFQPQAQPGGISGVSNPVYTTPFGQRTTTQSNMVMQPTLVSNPFGTLPAMPQMSIGNGGSSSPSVQYGISSLPVAEKPHPSRTLSMVVPRHLSQRRIKLLPRKYNATLDGKVAFFADDEESPVTPKADAFFTPRENPRSLIIRPADQWPSRSVVDRQSIPRDSAHLDKDKDAFVGREHNKAAMSPTRSGPVENGHHASSELDAVARHVNGASIEKIMPKLSRADYFTEPSLEELAAKERAEPGYCCQVRDFVVGRQGYGSIQFLGETDVRGLDLESIVEFNNREVVVYKDDSKKPPVGEGLNKAAVVTLLNIKCMNRKTGEEYTEGPRVEKFKEMLVKTAEKQAAEFVSFDGAKGEWNFRVKNFSS